MTIHRLIAPAALICSALLTSYPALAQFSQQGPKLVGTGATSMQQQQGIAVSLSADGNTAIVGGYTYNFFGNFVPGTGGAWVWTRSGAVWTQQGTMLLGSGTVGAFPEQGASVAISADGNTAIVGGPGDNVAHGAAWPWTRNGGVWIQQGTKLVGLDAVGYAAQGLSVSLSADGNTAIVGGPSDSGFYGAAWVWTRTGGSWAQQGAKLVGSGAVGQASQGRSVSLSADGNTAIVGGVGAAWVWTRSGGVWTQQDKLVSSGASPEQGWSVSLSADGSTAIVGGPYDDSVGAAWVWTRSGGVWTQQSTKLAGGGAAGNAQQGTSVSISGDGNTALVGGPADFGEAGAAWVFVVDPSSVPIASVWTLVALVLMVALLGAIRTRS